MVFVRVRGCISVSFHSAHEMNLEEMMRVGDSQFARGHSFR